MSKISIFGKPDCSRCQLAKRLFAGANYHGHDALYDLYDPDTATEIVTASGGELPIIIIESPAGRLVLGPSKASREADCGDGACRIF